MPELFARVEMPWVTNLPDDYSVNTFMFHSDAGVQDLAASALTIAQMVRNFYIVQPDAFFDGITNHEPQGSVGGHLSPLISRVTNACLVSMYDATTHLDEDDMGSPIHVEPFTMTPNTGDGLPPNVHLALTWEGEGRRTAPVETGGTKPKQRRTGHIKIGPLGTAVLDQAGSGIGRPTNAFLTVLLGAANSLENAVSGLDLEWHLSVWSRANAAVYPIEAVSVDDAFDTLAGRELAPTVRRRLDT